MGEYSAPSAAASPVAEDNLNACIEQQIGRNLLLYQRIELVLKKLLVMGGRVHGPIDHVEKRLAKKLGQVAQSTLGVLVGRVFSEVLVASPAQTNAVASDPRSITVAVSRVIEAPGGSDEFQRLQDALATLAQRRNVLVHHFVQNQALATVDGKRAVLRELEEDNVIAARLQYHLSCLADGMRAAMERHAAYLQSDAFADAFDTALAAGDVVQVLCETARESKDVDGWQWLDTAHHRIRAGVPASRERLTSRWGKRWLDQVLSLADEVFECETQLVPGSGAGQTRVRYRLKPDQPAET